MNTLINLQLFTVNLIWYEIDFCSGHALKAQYLCLSLLMKIIWILSTTKKVSELSFLCLDGFNISICFQNYQTNYFFCSQEGKFSTIKELFHSQGTFSRSRNFSNITELFHNPGTFLSQGNFPQSKNFFIIKEFFHNQRTFLQWWTFSQSKSFSES